MTHPIFDLPIEMFNCIADFLSIRDKQILKYTNNFFNNIICIQIGDFDEMITKIICNVLKNQTLCQKIIDLVKMSNGYIQIGGSTILQSIHNENYDKYDIDIYIDCSQMLQNMSWWDDKIEKYKYICENSNIANSKCALKSTIIEKWTCIQYYDKLLQLLREYGMSYDDSTIDNYSFTGSITNLFFAQDNERNIKIQIIMITTNYMDIPHDFTFCKNIYDGKNVYSLSKSDVLYKLGTMNDWKFLNKKKNGNATKQKNKKLL